MDQSKFRKIVIASTVTAVILLVTLLSVMVYQLVSIFTYKNAIAEPNVIIKRNWIRISISPTEHPVILSDSPKLLMAKTGKRKETTYGLSLLTSAYLHKAF